MHDPDASLLGDDFARSVATHFLAKALMTASEEQIRKEVLDAQERVGAVLKSPLFKTSLNCN